MFALASACAGTAPNSSCGDGDPALRGYLKKVGEFRAVDVARDEEYKEGSPFWLCRLLEHAYHLSAPFVVVGTLLTRAGGLLRYSGSLIRFRRKETTALSAWRSAHDLREHFCSRRGSGDSR